MSEEQPVAFDLESAVKEFTQKYPCEITKTVVLDEDLKCWAGRVVHEGKDKGIVMVAGDDNWFLYHDQFKKLMTLLHDDEQPTSDAYQRGYEMGVYTVERLKNDGWMEEVHNRYYYKDASQLIRCAARLCLADHENRFEVNVGSFSSDPFETGNREYKQGRINAARETLGEIIAKGGE